MKRNINDWKRPEGKERTLPFWAWNGRMTHKGIRESLRKIKEAGFGGAFVHPRPGLTVPYLSEEWFHLFGVALKEAKRLGLCLCIYDENTYPTGYGGGHVMSSYPDCAARSIKVRIFDNSSQWSEFAGNIDLPEETRTPIRLYEIENVGKKITIIREVTEETKEVQDTCKGKLLALIYQQSYSSPWFGGFPNPDILRSEVTKALLDSTYEVYFAHFGEDFGTWIPAVFSDEPGISPGNVNLEDPMVFPYSPYFAYEFFQRRGYVLEDYMAAICLDLEGLSMGFGAEKIRYDYYCTLRELWIQNFAQPIREWCDGHNIAWTGHFLDEHWPYPWGCASPSVMSMYEWMNWPGIDMLMTHMLKKDGKSSMLLSVKELESVGEQLGKERLLCECYGAGGWDAEIDDFKRIGDWLAVHGITLFNQHLILDSLEGVRKYGHPQSFDWREPWWPEYKKLNEYYARAGKILAEGKRNPSILLLHPTTSWYLEKPDSSEGNILWDFDSLKDASRIRTYITKLQEWEKQGLNFDLGDEFLMEKYGSVSDGTLSIGGSKYSVIYIPKEMRHMRKATVDLLEQAVNAGIQIYMEEKSIRFIEGEHAGNHVLFGPLCKSSDFVKQMKQEHKVIVPIIGKGISVTRRECDDGKHRYFFVNSMPVTKSVKAVLPGNSIYKLNLFEGKEALFAVRNIEDGCELEITLCPEESLMLESRWEEEHVAVPSNEDEREVSTENLQPQSIELQGPNVLCLDYGVLDVRNQTWDNIYVGKACEKIYQAHGWEKNPWDMAIQYRDRILDRNQYNSSSGFTFTYEFVIQDCPQTLQAAIEHPEWILVELNGKLVQQQKEAFWMDEMYGIYNLSNGVREGKNILSIQVSPFHVCLELQPVYLLGDFALQPGEKGFFIRGANKLTLGGLKKQGVWFYGGRVIYRFTYCKEQEWEKVWLQLGQYEATAFALTVNKKTAAQSGTGRQEKWEIGRYLQPGVNEIILELCTSLKNLFGPHHTPHKVRNSAWPNAWKMAPEFEWPKGSDYDCIDYGLKDSVSIICVNSQNNCRRVQRT